MLSNRVARASAVGLFVLVSILLVLGVAGVFSSFRSHGKMMRVQGGDAVATNWRGGMMGSDDRRGTMKGNWGVLEEKMMAPQASIEATGTDATFAAPMMASPMMGSTVVDVQRKVSTSVSLDMRAKSLDWTVGKVREIVKNVGGFVENSTLTQPDKTVRTAWMSVKVPADRFDAVLAEVKQTADEVVSENMGSTDVTAQSIDLSARLSNKQAEEQSYERLLSSATKVSDVIEVTTRLTQVRTEIESIQQQMRYLEGQTAMATLSLSITEDARVQGDTGEFQRGNVFKLSLNVLVDALVALGSGLVMFLISGLPIILILLAVLWGVFRLAKRMVDKLFL